MWPCGVSTWRSECLDQLYSSGGKYFLNMFQFLIRTCPIRLLNCLWCAFLQEINCIEHNQISTHKRCQLYCNLTKVLCNFRTLETPNLGGQLKCINFCWFFLNSTHQTGMNWIWKLKGYSPNTGWMYEFPQKFRKVAKTQSTPLLIGDFGSPNCNFAPSILMKTLWMGSKKPIPGAPQCMNFP